MGYIAKECPSKRAYIATDDGGYASASDEENEFALATDLYADKFADSAEDPDEVIDSVACTADYKSILVQRVLSTQVEPVDKLQRHNLFQMFLIINNFRVRAIIDGGSSNNLVSSELVKTLGLSTRVLPHSYHVQWFNNSGKTKVTQSARVHFSIGSYHDSVDFDVAPMQACSLLLGCPWQYDNNALHHGRQNRYTFIFKGKTIALLPLTPAEIVQYEKELAEKKKKGHDRDFSKPTNEPSSNMKEVLFSLKSVLADHDEPCYALTCTPASSAMPLVGTNLLQEKEDEFPIRKPPWQPHLRRMGRQDERLLLDPSLLSSNGGDNLFQSRTTSIQEREDDEDITTSSHTSQGEEEVQHGRPIHLFHGGSPVQLKFESGSGSRTSLP
jgi:hypothetical protein